MGKRTPPPVDRFWPKVVRDPETECWLWTASTNSGGYGLLKVGERLVRAHRFAYELLVGPIPEGLQIDHLCRVRTCVNPAHMEPVTSRVNTLRGDGLAAKQAAQTRCKHGHPFDEANTHHWRGHRWCRTCSRHKQLRRNRHWATHDDLPVGHPRGRGC